MLSNQKQKIVQQEKIIRHLRGKIGEKKVSVEDVEIIALRRLPKLVESVPDDQKSEASNNVDVETVVNDDAMNEKSDSDSAIHLDRSFDCLTLTDRTEEETRRSRHLQRSVSDVVQTQVRHVRMCHSETEVSGREKVSPFCDTIYRGFLLRHQRRHKTLKAVNERQKCSDQDT